MSNEPLIIPDDIHHLAEQLVQLRNNALCSYTAIVDRVISDEITDVCEIERIMDGLLDFCDDERFIGIYRKLCRHIYYRHPEMVGEHVALFLAQFKEARDSDND